MKNKSDKSQLSLFEIQGPVEGMSYQGRHIRRGDKVFFPVVDVIEAVAETKRPAKYWKDMKDREHAELSAICGKFYVPHQNGRQYEMECVDIEGAFRLIQSIPSPKAEPVKRWLAKIAYERVEEAANPELGISRAKDRAVEAYRRKGYDDAWISKRIKSIYNRNIFTDTLKASGVKDPGEYAARTAISHSATFGMPPKSHKELKGLSKKASLRDNMMSGELSLTSIAEDLFSDMVQFKSEHETLDDVQEKHAGLMAKMRKDIEATTGRKVARPESPRKQIGGS